MKNVPSSSFIKIIDYVDAVMHKNGKRACCNVLESWTQHMFDSFSQCPEERNTRLHVFLSGLLTIAIPENHALRLRNEYIIWRAFVSADEDANFRVFVDAVCSLLKREDEFPEFAYTVKEYLNKSSEEELASLTVEILAAKFKMHRNHFSRHFHNDLGYSVHEAIANTKLDRAFNMLIDENDSTGIAKLANRLGYSSAEHFRNMFRNRFGFLPSELKT